MTVEYWNSTYLYSKYLLFFVFQTKDICHVWELGGGLVFKDLLSVIVQKTRGRRLSVVLVLDLSKPDILWNTMEMLLEEVKIHLGNVLEIEEYNQINVKNIEVCFSLYIPIHHNLLHFTCVFYVYTSCISKL